MSIPVHIAIIMDGNRRWAKKHGLISFEGHKQGEKGIEPIVDEAVRLGIKVLTFWAFSTDNWQRNSKEVSFLISLLRSLLENKMDRYHLKKVKIKFIGDLSRFSTTIQKKLDYWMDKTKDNRSITVNIALSYGGRDEIIRAINKWHEKIKNQKSKIKINKEELEKYLDTAGQPDVDLLIRTGGEKRLSGFLLWQMEYAELYFTDIFWPDFTINEFQKAVQWYQERERRFGR